MNLKKNEKGKMAAAKKAAALVSTGMKIGLGTGSTSEYFIQALAELVKNGLKIQAVATSKKSYDLAQDLGIEMCDINAIKLLSFTIDGADEIDLGKQMIKGGGGALLREKIVAHMADEMIVIADESKLVKQLGQFPIPVEVTPFAIQVTMRFLENLGAKSFLRKGPDNLPYITDNGNYIVDLKFQDLNFDPPALNLKLKAIPGVLETGLFINMAGRVIIGYEDGRTEII